MTTYRKFDWNRSASDFYTLFTDFNEYAATDWVITTVEAGASSATEALANAAGGQLVVTNDTADDDSDMFQWAGGAGAAKETFKYVSGKKLRFATRFKLSRVDGDFFAGLYITDTDPAGGLSDGIYFRKLAAEAGLQIVAEKDSTETEATVITTLVADTWYVAEFYYDGANARIMVYIDGAVAGSIALTNAPDDEELALSFGIENGSANAGVLTVDYIGAACER
jgi:hypothetical protein